MEPWHRTVVVEIKTTINAQTTNAGVQITGRVGMFIRIAMEDAHAFHQCIPDLSHGVQIIHHMVVTGSSLVFMYM